MAFALGGQAPSLTNGAEHERLETILVVALPPDAKLGRVMQLIKGRFSNRYNKAVGRVGRLWQERYHERALRSERELLAAREYVHLNPVKGGLVADARCFLWSSANPIHATDLDRYLSG